MDLIKVSINGEMKFIDQAIAWCKENNICLQRYQPIHSENMFGRAMIHGFVFYFSKEEDAIAFKLRWL